MGGLPPIGYPYSHLWGKVSFRHRTLSVITESGLRYRGECGRGEARERVSESTRKLVDPVARRSQLIPEKGTLINQDISVPISHRPKQQHLHGFRLCSQEPVVWLCTGCSDTAGPPFYNGGFPYRTCVGLGNRLP